MQIGCNSINSAPEEEQLKFSNQWVKGWKLEYGVSLRHPNKRYSISKEGCSIRVQDYLKNIWNVRHNLITKFGINPTIINGDQMPLHRNKSRGEATLSMKMKISSLFQNFCLKALANVHRNSRHLQEYTINRLTKFHTV